jgi:hypothetical protein
VFNFLILTVSFIMPDILVRYRTQVFIFGNGRSLEITQLCGFFVFPCIGGGLVPVDRDQTVEKL